MNITPRGGAAIVLVDPAVGDFQPVPAVSFQQLLAEYHITGGQSHSYALGGARPDVSAQVVLIDQVDDATAWIILGNLSAAVLDEAQQPMDVDWDDNAATPWDGTYFIGLAAAPEVSTDFVGRIKLTLTMRPADDSDLVVPAAPTSLHVQANGATQGDLSEAGIAIG